MMIFDVRFGDLSQPFLFHFDYIFFRDFAISKTWIGVRFQFNQWFHVISGKRLKWITLIILIRYRAWYIYKLQIVQVISCVSFESNFLRKTVFGMIRRWLFIPVAPLRAKFSLRSANRFDRSLCLCAAQVWKPFAHTNCRLGFHRTKRFGEDVIIIIN